MKTTTAQAKTGQPSDSGAGSSGAAAAPPSYGIDFIDSRQPNRTGLPDQLKTGVENLSGMSMDSVRVHYNSDKPAQLQALAYTQGTDIYVAPGREKHLAHEAWHVVQQAQARVKPTLQTKGLAVNDDAGLEREADVMGGKSMQLQVKKNSYDGFVQMKRGNATSSSATVQRKVGFEIEVIGQEIVEEEARNPHLKKGEELHKGDGWKLTPDNKREGYSWTPEYIVAAIDETTDAKRITDKVLQVQAHAEKHLDNPKGWSNGQNLLVEKVFPYELLGSFHVTGGLRLSRISELIKHLYPAEDKKSEKTDEALAKRAEAIGGWSGSNYKSVVALVALQISDLLNAPKNEKRDNLSAKQSVSILSRTDLGRVVTKATKYTPNATFIHEVLAVAKVNGADKIFKNKLPGAAATGRSIDDEQNLTVNQWLNKLVTGADYVWSDTKNDAGQSFPLEAVGPSNFGHRAEGVVLELRGLQEQANYSAPLKDWHIVANKYATLFAMMNAKESFDKVEQEFRPPKHKKKEESGYDEKD